MLEKNFTQLCAEVPMVVGKSSPMLEGEADFYVAVFCRDWSKL